MLQNYILTFIKTKNEKQKDRQQHQNFQYQDNYSKDLNDYFIEKENETVEIEDDQNELFSNLSDCENEDNIIEPISNFNFQQENLTQKHLSSNQNINQLSNEQNSFQNQENTNLNFLQYQELMKENKNLKTQLDSLSKKLNISEFKFQSEIEEKESMIIDLNATLDDYDNMLHVNLVDEIKITKGDIYLDHGQILLDAKNLKNTNNLKTLIEDLKERWRYFYQITSTYTETIQGLEKFYNGLIAQKKQLEEIEKKQKEQKKNELIDLVDEFKDHDISTDIKMNNLKNFDK
jgi:hypothetical protein